MGVARSTTGNGRPNAERQQREPPMAMSADFYGKGGTTMVMLTGRWIGGLFDAVAPACPREELVRRT